MFIRHRLMVIAGSAALVWGAGDAGAAVLDAASVEDAGFSIRFLQRPGNIPVLNPGGGINLSGEVLGSGGLKWTPDGQMVVLTSTLPGLTTTTRGAGGMNASGAVVGYIATLGSTDPAVVWAPDGTVQALPEPVVSSPYSSTQVGEATAINASGTIVGVNNYSGPLFSGMPRPTKWVYANGAYTGTRLDSGVSSGGSPAEATVNDISDSGLMSGTVTYGTMVSHPTAVMWSASNQLAYLPDPTISKTILSTSSVAIAENGTVAGNVHYYLSGSGGDFASRGLRWVPYGSGYAVEFLDGPGELALASVTISDVTADGRFAIGNGWFGTINHSESVGLLWFEDGTSMLLDDLLQDASWEVTDVRSIAAGDDRMLISAYARPANTTGDAVPVVLTAIVPEPSVLAVLGVVAPALLLRRRPRGY